MRLTSQVMKGGTPGRSRGLQSCFRFDVPVQG